MADYVDGWDGVELRAGDDLLRYGCSAETALTCAVRFVDQTVDFWHPQLLTAEAVAEYLAAGDRVRLAVPNPAGALPSWARPPVGWERTLRTTRAFRVNAPAPWARSAAPVSPS